MTARGRAGRDRDDEDDDDDDDISEYVVTGKDLKRALKRGRRRAVPFAFCPVSGDETTWFATHKKRSPARIAKRTRRDSGQFKVAFGTFVVEGRLLLLTCEDILPNLAKRVKKHLAQENIRMSVRALDAGGAEIDADIEDFPDDLAFDLDVEDDDDDGGPASPADSFAARLERVHGPVLAARGEAGNRLREILGGIFDAHDKGDRISALTLLERLEKHVGQVMNSASRPAAAARPAPRRKEAGDSFDKQEQLSLARTVRDLRKRAAALDGSAGERITAALAIGARQIRGGDLIGAAETIAKVAEALERVEARAGDPAA